MSINPKTPGYRERVEVAGPDYDTFVRTKNGNVVTSQNHLIYTSRESMFDVNTPNYRARIRRGDIINNPCEYDLEVSEAGGGYYSAVGPVNTYASSGGSPSYWAMQNASVGYLTDPSIVADEPAHRGESKFLALSHVDETPYAFGEDVGEIRETLKFLRSPFSSLLKLGKSFDRELAHRLTKKRRRKGLSPRKISRYAQEFSDTWTEYRFAASPLVRSTMDVLEAATWYQGSPPLRKTARGHLEHTDGVTDMVDKDWGNGQHDYFLREDSYTLDTSSGILYQVSNPVEDLQWRLGLRVKDVPATVWQLLPYSFMIDRIVNVSQLIQGLSALADPRVKILAGWCRQKATHRQSCQWIDAYYPTYTTTVSAEPVSYQHSAYTREVWIPSLSDLVPPVKPLGLVKDVSSTLDLVALTYQFFTRQLAKK